MGKQQPATKRVVSLIPSATEIVYALGFGEQLVGRSHECDYPPEVRALPICTESKLDLNGASYQIDQRVKAILQESLAVYRVFSRRLDELRPDVIITQTQCDVCAVSLADVETAVCQMVGSRPEIVALEPNCLDDVWRDVGRVATALDAPERGQALVQSLQEQMDAIATQAVALAERPTVACIEWIEPLMAAGNWMPTLVEMAGGVNLFGAAGEHSPWLTWEQLQAADPDLILIVPCGFDIARTRQELARPADRPDWTTMRAVQNGRVYVADGNQYFNRPGPRLVESLEILAEILHPAHFRFGHEGTGWVQALVSEKTPISGIMKRNNRGKT